MALIKRTISKGHPQNPRRYFLQQIPSPVGTEAETSYYKVSAISTIYNLMMPGVITFPAEQKSKITSPKIPQ